MSVRFGAFEFDAEQRLLSLRGARQDIQPLVFDFLAHLIANAGRVVSKGDLMDRLWPNVHVTESSLQRLASVARRTLAAGGMAGAVQSYSKHGYGFVAGAETDPAEDDDPLDQARRAISAKDWLTASRLFASAGDLTTADLELWAAACECRGQPAEAIPVLVRAIERHRSEGNLGRAGRAAITVAWIEAERGAGAVSQGWIERAASLVEGVDDLAVHAYLAWIRARSASLEGKPDEALDLASEAALLAEQSDDQALRALTLAFKGFYHLSLGEVGEGRRLQNHAAAITLSSQVDPITGALVYCNILWSCRTHADWERASAWSEGFEAWCAASFAESSGACDLHRAEMLGVHGSLQDARRKIDSAIPKLSGERAIALGEAHRIRGDIAAMMGDTTAAVRDYSHAYALGWDAEPGNAVLLAEQGKVDCALEALDRVLNGTHWFDLQRRGVILANAARISARAGRRDLADAYLAAFAEGEDRWSQAALLALVSEAKAALAGPGSKAIDLLVRARQLWGDALLDFQAARVRLELAQAYRAYGRHADAEAELAQAERAARRVGSEKLLGACGDIRRARDKVLLSA